MKRGGPPSSLLVGHGELKVLDPAEIGGTKEAINRQSNTIHQQEQNHAAIEGLRGRSLRAEGEERLAGERDIGPHRAIMCGGAGEGEGVVGAVAPTWADGGLILPLRAAEGGGEAPDLAVDRGRAEGGERFRDSCVCVWAQQTWGRGGTGLYGGEGGGGVQRRIEKEDGKEVQRRGSKEGFKGGVQRRIEKEGGKEGLKGGFERRV